MIAALPVLSAEIMEIVERAWGIAIVRGLVWALIAVLLIITPMALMSIWLERRLSGKMQARIGPNRVGPEGLLQTLADGVKLLGKENLVPEGADRPLFHIAPIVVFVAAFGMYGDVTVKELMAQLGLTGSPAQRAQPMLAALGVARPFDWTLDAALGDPELLTSSYRRWIVERREAAGRVQAPQAVNAAEREARRSLSCL